MKHFKQKTKRNLLLCAAAATVILLALLIVSGVSGLMDSSADTGAGVEYITQEEAGSVTEIETKINRMEQSASEGGSGDGRSVRERFTRAVVMGDSIAQGFAEFDVLPASSVTAELDGSLTRLDSQIEATDRISPGTVFLALGLEDVAATNGDTDVFISEYTAVLDRIRQELPGVNVFVNSIFPVQQTAVDNEPLLDQIPAYNEALKALCSSRDIGFIDNTELVQDQYYDPDGIHFRAEFYPIWAEHMAEVAAL